MDYVNPPVGEGRKPPAPLKPLLAIPTTCGHRARRRPRSRSSTSPTSSVKTGISHRYLRPHQAIVDPELTRVAAAPR